MRRLLSRIPSPFQKGVSNRVISGLILATLVYSSTGSLSQGQTTPPAPHEDEQELSPADLIAEFLGSDNSGGPGKWFTYYHVPPAGEAGQKSTAPAGEEGAPHPAAKKTLDVSITQQAYNGSGPGSTGTNTSPGKPPVEVFNEFMKALDSWADEGKHGADGVREVQNGPWGEELIKATIQVLDANGDNSPKAIKQLIKDKVVSSEHAALMWLARDMLVRKTADRVMNKLQSQHPGLRFEITILDSGTYGSVGSDIDKSAHVTVWDSNGNEVKAFGTDGRVFGGDIARFIALFFSEFNALGSEVYKAKNPIALSLDTEFFPSDTLPRRFGRGATHGIVRALAENFAALQRNPGPAYQFIAKVVSQVIGRTVEQDVGLKQQIEALARKRGLFDELSRTDRRSLFLSEMLTTVHSPAVVVAMEDGKVVIRPVNVIEFLERNNLALRYTRSRAVGNALGDYEKLSHKRYYIIDAEGVFHADKHKLYENDIAKYADRAIKDTLTALVDDTGPDKPVALGDFNRRFGPENAKERFFLETDPPNLREYTFEEHKQLFEPVLRKVYGDSPERIQQDLQLYWIVNRINETLLAIKSNAELAKAYPPEVLYLDLIIHMENTKPGVFSDFEGSEAEVSARRVEAAKREHFVASEDLAVKLSGGYLKLALEGWLESPEPEIQRILEISEDKLLRLKKDRDRLLKTARLPGSEEAAAKQTELRTLDHKIEELAAQIREIQTNPEAEIIKIRAGGQNLARRLFEIFQRGHTDPNFAAMLALLPMEYRQDLGLMFKVYAVQASEAEKARLARRVGIDFKQLGAWSRATARRLGYSYAAGFGIDTEAYFKNTTFTAKNAPSKVLGRFFRENYVHLGLVDSALRLLQAMQLSQGLPFEQRMSMFSEALSFEMISPIPAFGPVFLTWKGYQSGDPRVLAGGIVNGIQELAQKWIGATAGSLDDAMIAAGQGIRSSALGALSRAGSLASLYLSIARISVEIVGHAVFEPLRDTYFQLAYQGFVDPESSGSLLPGIGIERFDNLAVIPIIEPGTASAFEFLYLSPGDAQYFLEDLRANGESRAALALMHLAGLDENLDPGFSPDGRCGSTGETGPGTTPAACPVLIDLKTDFAELIAAAKTQNLRVDSMPDDLRQRAEHVRSRAINTWEELGGLQRQTWARIRRDREIRQQSVDGLNTWLLAARQNLGLFLDEQFRRQQNLLHQQLIGVPGPEEVFEQEAEAAWERWQNQAPSWERPSVVRKQFLEVMIPWRIYEQRLERLREQIEGVQEIPWSHPAEMVKEFTARQAAKWLQWERPEDRRRQEQVRQLERQITSLHAFVENSYADREGSTPTEPYVLEEATAWFAARVRNMPDPVPPSDGSAPGVGQMAAQVVNESRRQLLVEEHSLVMKGFGEIDAVVAPKIAQLLLMDWIEGTGPFGRLAAAANLSLKFLWHDEATQRRVRTRVAQDLVAGRRLIPQYRSQAATYKLLLDAELGGIYLEYARLTDDKIRQFYRDALRYAETRADARAKPDVFNGELELTVEPYIVFEDGKLSVTIDAKAEHEVYRALEVEVAADTTKIIPFDAIAKVIGREVYDDALEFTGLSEEKVLFAIQVNAAVVKAIPPEGYEKLSYDKLPESNGHLLLVPGRKDVQPRVVAKPVVTICAIAEDAPDDFPYEEAADHCDNSIDKIFPYDHIALFFTPARDPGDEERTPEAFYWQLLSPAGEPLYAGPWGTHVRGGYSSVEGSWGGPVAGARPLTWMQDGSPGRFGYRAWLWSPFPPPDHPDTTPGPGRYIVQTADLELTDEEAFILGQYVGDYEPGEEWQTEGEFELADVRLHFQGFVAEPSVVKPLSGDSWVGWQGAIDPMKTSVAGSTVSLDLSASWHMVSAEPDSTSTREEDDAQQQPEPSTQKARSRMTLGFPKTIDLGGEAKFAVSTELQNIETGFDRSESEYAFVFKLGKMITTAQSPPDRHLLRGDDLPEPWPNWSAWEFDLSSGGKDEDSSFSLFTANMVASHKGHITFSMPKGNHLKRGLPPRGLAWHLRDEKTIWVIPVVANFGGGSLNVWSAVGYAIYGPQPEAYTGPSPQGDPVPEADEVTPTKRDSDDGDDPTKQSAVPSTTIGEGAAGAAERIRDAGLEPTFVKGPPAKPPHKPGTVHSTTPPAGTRPADGKVRVTVFSDPVVAVPSLVGQRVAVASQRLAEGGLGIDTETGVRAPSKSQARTIYEQVPTAESSVMPGTTVRVTAYGDWITRVPDVIGESETAARHRLQDEELVVKTRTGIPAPPGKSAGIVYHQMPAVDSEVEPGTTVQVTVYAEALVVVPNLLNTSGTAARDALRRVNLRMQTHVGRTSRTLRNEGVVYDQLPAARSKVRPGTTVTVTVYGNAVTVVPNLVNRSEAQARDTLHKAGLKSQFRRGRAARSQSEEGIVYDQRPPARSTVRLATTVAITVYDIFVDPKPPPNDKPKATEFSLDGRWQRPGGEIIRFIRQPNGSLRAAYSNNNGRLIVVNFDGRFLNLIWAQDNYKKNPRRYCPEDKDEVSYWGMTRLEWKPERQRLEGTYNYCGDPARYPPTPYYLQKVSP